MKRIVAIGLAMIVLLAVAGCGGSGNGIDRGVVVGFHFYPAHQDTGFYPMYGMTCFAVGNSQSCTPYLMGMFPYTDSYPNEWALTLLRCWPKPAHCKTGDVQVGEREYNSVKIGDYLGPPLSSPVQVAHKPKVKRVTGKKAK